jgi:nucleotide-binding universal stress UspA family protein
MSMTEPPVVTELRLDGGVVVGDDGSLGAEAAIRYALGEAQRRRSTLHVVRAWTITSATPPPGAPFGYVPSLTEFEAATLEATQQRVKHLVGDSPGVAVEVHVVYGPAAKALIAASQTTDVLVVGSRGLGGFASLVLGSVADQCIRHSAGPVIVVR